MKKSLLVISLLGLFLTSFSQQTIKKTPDWTLIFENDQVRMYSKYMNCEIPDDGLYAEYVILKAENKTSQTIQLTWFNDTYYGEDCSNCDHSKNDTKRTIELNPNKTMEGNCDPGLNLGLKVFSKWLKMETAQPLTRLTIANISSSALN